MKCKCGNNLFNIQVIPCCDGCDQNAAYDEITEEYIRDTQEIENRALERTEVGEDGQCGMGSAYGSGCYLFVCSKCHRKTNFPVYGSC